MFDQQASSHSMTNRLSKDMDSVNGNVRQLLASQRSTEELLSAYDRLQYDRLQTKYRRRSPPATYLPREETPKCPSLIPKSKEDIDYSMTESRHRVEMSPRHTILPTLKRITPSFLEPGERLKRLDRLRHSSPARARDIDV